MQDYGWTWRVWWVGLGLVSVWAMFSAVMRVSGLVIAGVQPEAWALVAMMTAPLALGVVLLATVGTALAETWRRLVAGRRLEEEADVQD